MKLFLTLLISILFFSHAIAQTESVSEKNNVSVKVGTVFNAEKVLSNSKVIFGLSLGLDYQRKISNSVSGGVRIQYFSLDNTNYYLLAPCIYSSLIEKEKMNLLVISNIGYSLADHQSESGMDWGGVNLGLGIENNYKVGADKNVELGIGLNYFLQERKYNTIFGLDSDMKHVLGLNFSIAKKF